MYVYVCVCVCMCVCEREREREICMKKVKKMKKEIVRMNKEIRKRGERAHRKEIVCVREREKKIRESVNVFELFVFLEATCSQATNTSKSFFTSLGDATFDQTASEMFHQRLKFSFIFRVTTFS